MNSLLFFNTGNPLISCFPASAETRGHHFLSPLPLSLSPVLVLFPLLGGNTRSLKSGKSLKNCYFLIGLGI